MGVVINKAVKSIVAKSPEMAGSTLATKVKLAPNQLEKGEQEMSSASVLAVLVDDYGRLEAEVKKAMDNPVFTLFEEVKVRLKAELDKVEPELDVDLKGVSYKIHASAGSKKPAEITDMNGVRVALGDKLFMELCSVTLANLRKYLTPAQLDCVIDEDTGRTLNRKIVVKHVK